MAPADTLSPPGAAAYSSDTMTVGDGTWDFSRNSFLLPNLVGLNFDTMRYNGMANRFSTFPQYHSLILAHGVLAAMAFLFIIPTAVMFARFYTARPGYAIIYHAQLQIVAFLLVNVVFILGFFAVGHPRSLTNPHHGIGVAIYVLFWLQLIGGRLVRHISGRSLRVNVHHWSGRAIALLGIAQVPLGLTLYGSPKYLFVLYTLWMVFLVLVYFILSYRREGQREAYIRGVRSDGHSRVTESEYVSDVHHEKPGGIRRWIGPLAAGAGIWALLRRRKDRERSRSRSRSRLSRSRSRSHAPEVIPSRRGSASYYEEDEKYSEAPKRSSGGGLMKGLLAAGAAVGAGKLIKNYMDKREDRRRRDDEYSAVSTETPRRHRPSRHDGTISDYSEVSERYNDRRRDDGRGSILPPPGDPVATAAALSAAEARPSAGARPVTPRPSHLRNESRRSFDESDYSSYVSPSRRRDEERKGGVGKGLLAGLGLGWFAKKLADRRSRQHEDKIRDEEELRSHGSRYTGDGYPSPTRRSSRRPAPPPSGRVTETILSEGSSQVEQRPLGGPSHVGPPMPPLPAGALPPGAVPPPPMAPPVPMPVPGSTPGSHSRLGTVHDPVPYPPMPPDPHGILYRESGSEEYMSAGGRPHRRHSSRRRRAAEEAVASAGVLAAEEEARRRREEADRRAGATPPSADVSLKMKVHGDPHGSVTIRQLTEEEKLRQGLRERERERERRRRGNDDSVSSLSGVDSPTNRRYRREPSAGSARRRAEVAAERMVSPSPPVMAPLSPPNPAFASASRRQQRQQQQQKDSAYYSGQPGPSVGMVPPPPPPGGPGGLGSPGMSALGSPESRATWSGMSPSPSLKLDQPPAGSLAPSDRRQRRRLERRRSASRPTAGPDMFD